ncbi:class I adenylate-forming enzyme family protein [Gilvimarinus sp. F26214L]|uniref:class I adenylate-forming enzyme family protein n=1 Tax=Gilvimarinus sp. DZF01 TaxID=3461371 RepID=UPI0040460BBF
MTENLDEILLRRVRKHPQQEAIAQGDIRLCYGELWDRIEDLAHTLSALGLCPGERVVLLMENSADYVIAYYATLRAKAVVVPLNTTLKSEQVGHLIRHAEARLVLHNGQLLRHGLWKSAGQVQYPGHGRVIAIDECDAPGTAQGGTTDDEALCSIVYTSGTTGEPKGVMLSHANLVSNTRAIVSYLELTANDRGMCVLPFYYAYGNSVLHSHLAAGACLVLENSLLYPQQVLAHMQEESVTGFAGVPSTYRLLMRRCDLSRHPLPRLRYLTQAGGALAPDDVQKVRKGWPHARFYVMYGQTEATARLSYLPPDQLENKLGTVGVPVPGVSLKIMDNQGREVPRGETGEICARGPNIMLGYWRNEEATAARFFGEWLRTGDMGHQDEDGFITVVGRRSDIIKTGDHRVAPEEIEQAIASLDGVQEVAVVGIPDAILGQVIKAFVVVAPGRELSARDVLRHCKQHCAQYKIPKEVEFASDLPRTASGKVQRFKLMQLDLTANCT